MPKSEIIFEPKVGQLVEVVDKKSSFYGLSGQITKIDEDVPSAIEVNIPKMGQVFFWKEELQLLKEEPLP